MMRMWSGGRDGCLSLKRRSRVCTVDKVVDGKACEGATGIGVTREDERASFLVG